MLESEQFSADKNKIKMTTAQINLFNDIAQNPNMYSCITLTNGSILRATINGCEGDDADVLMVLDEERTAQAEAIQPPNPSLQ